MENLSGKRWYRLLQVIFGISLVLGIIIIILLGLSFKPVNTIDQDKTTFTCTDKESTRYNQSYGFNGTGVYLYYDESLSSADTKTINNWCTYGNYLYTGNGDYYQLNIVYKQNGNWLRFISITIGVVVLYILVLLLIRKLFLYIVLGNLKTTD